MWAYRYMVSTSTDSPHQPPSEEWTRSVISRLWFLLDQQWDSDFVRQYAPMFVHYVMSAPPAAEGILQRLQNAIEKGICQSDLLGCIWVYHTGVVCGCPHPLDIFMKELEDRLEGLESDCSIFFSVVITELLIWCPKRALKLINSIDKALKLGRTLHTEAPEVINDVCMYVHGLRPTQPLDTLLDTLFRELNQIHRDLVYVVSLHPAVAKALGLPVRPWLSLNSAYIKYMVLRNMVVRNKIGLDLLLQPGEEQREQVLKGYLMDLYQTQEQNTIIHPLLWMSEVSMITRNRLIPTGVMWRKYSSLLHFLETVVLKSVWDGSVPDWYPHFNQVCRERFRVTTA